MEFVFPVKEQEISILEQYNEVNWTFIGMVVVKIKKILKAIMFTLLWFLAVTTVCIAVKGIIYVIGLLIGEAMATLLSIILLLIFIAVFIYKEFL